VQFAKQNVMNVETVWNYEIDSFDRFFYCSQQQRGRETHN